jgi:hypothetical protein
MAEDQNRRNNSGRASNLTSADRSRGGQRSASIQQRDELGQFAGRRAGGEGNARGGRRGQRAGTRRGSR